MPSVQRESLPGKIDGSLVVAQMVMGEADAAAEQVGQRVARAETQSSFQQVKGVCGTTDKNPRPAYRIIDQRKARVNRDRALGRRQRLGRTPAHQMRETGHIL